MTAPESAYDWRYLDGSKSRHALTHPSDHTALCGRSPSIGCDWLGTGKQREYEIVAGLPACRNCISHMEAGHV